MCGPACLPSGVWVGLGGVFGTVGMGGGGRNGILGSTDRKLGGVLVAVGRVWAELKAELVSLFRGKTTCAGIGGD